MIFSFVLIKVPLAGMLLGMIYKKVGWQILEQVNEAPRSVSAKVLIWR
jgi:hypothetical protein